MMRNHTVLMKNNFQHIFQHSSDKVHAALWIQWSQKESQTSQVQTIYTV